MSYNSKTTSQSLAEVASKILRDDNASKIAKSLAGSALSQSNTPNQTGAELETKASKVMRSKKYSEETRSLAASILSQANRKR
ncbi:conserved hypothetical protein [Vibrio nigripulchritudo SOn1]|uniref:Uncharacterized protein n=1 Tax=Vibrio nigripulchritudo SOn1 TaxID=1238450 RepID=A0AAV2VNG1_9VIBR|nr:hypothetical protein [Vibrio nigripulchritudo]CCO46261.1 conserved hypothetical protein [Vibrio nigripulchritudo SOn1]